MNDVSHVWNSILCKLAASLTMSFSMAWEILWALILGFTLSAIVQTAVTRLHMNKWLADHSPKSISIATLLGAASSSCSYAAAAITRALVKQGADFTSAMAFQFASTNLVLELGILLALLLGWRFTLAQFVGGIIMITIMSLFFHLLLPKNLIDSATAQAGKESGGIGQCHAGMHLDLSGHTDNSSHNDVVTRIFSQQGKTAISHYFFMDWAALWTDIAFGLLIAGLLATCIPDSFWTILFCQDNSTHAHLLNPLIGPVIAILSFVCSIGNVPMAAVLWQKGMTFGGVLSFLFADLLIFPLLNIYRKYYGFKMASFIAISFYISMVTAAYCCEWLFTILGLVPTNYSYAQGGSILIGTKPLITLAEHHMMHHGDISLNYTTVLNIVALIFTAFLCKRFYQSGGSKMLRAHHSSLDESSHGCH